jgi:hypothetical protein
MISILVRIISITRMKLLMLPKAKKLDHFACKMGLHTSLIYKSKRGDVCVSKGPFQVSRNEGSVCLGTSSIMGQFVE